MESPISIETVGKIGKEPCSGCDHQAHLAVLYKKDSRIFVQHQSLLPLWRRFFSQIVVVGNLPVDTSTNLLVSGTTRCYCVHNNYPYIRIFKYEYIYIYISVEHMQIYTQIFLFRRSRQKTSPSDDSMHP